ncbi:MAG: hypothetical protein JWP12_1912 [Bacteroidetes bacterium]|nr:hypothetical protein [Bacteroidota bacterium]
MNKTFYILFFVFASVFCKAQTNLVYNGDFEMYDVCPVGPSSPFSIPYEIEHCLGWKAPTYATSDYLNTCNTSTVAIPANGFGYQMPYSGNGYCGFYAYTLSGGGCYNGSFWWEYIQGKFISPLVAGHIYRIGFYVSLGNNSNIAVGQLGFYISNTPVGNSCSPAPLNYVPQITSPVGVFLNDTTSWTLISGDYSALGGEEYITIGNFKDSITTDTLTVLHNTDVPNAYYFVDGGSTFDITDQKPIANVFTPNSDGENDLFLITGLEEIDKYIIYDRWGVKVFEGRYNVGWDGKTNAGLDCSNGVYYYIAEQKGKQTKKGFIQLLR